MATNITRAFGELRGRGYFARQNFMCCQSCAWAEVPDSKRSKTVFFHNQDYYNYKDGMTFFLSWTGDADEIIGVLEHWGLQVVWDGTENSRIGIIPTSVVHVNH